MAAEQIVIGAKITADTGQATESVKSWKTQIREARQELQSAAAQYGELSEQAIAAAQKVAELTDAMGDQKALVDKLNPDAKFAALAQGVQGAVGGVTALTGAMAAFGVNSENVEKTLLKVQGAMAMTQGINSLMEAKDGLKQMGAIVGGQLLKAFHALKAAIGATGIGLLVIALGAIVVYWDKIKGAITGYNAEAERALDLANKQVKAEEDKLAGISAQENTLRLQGMSEREILNLKIKQTEAVINAREQEILKQQEVFKGQVDAERRNRDILAGIIKFTTLPLQLLVDGISKVAAVFGKEFKFDIGKSVAGLVFDPEEAQQKQDKTLATMRKGIADIKNQRDGLRLSLQQMDKQEREATNQKRTAEQQSQKAHLDNRTQQEKEAAAERAKILQQAQTLEADLREANIRAGMTDRQKELRDIEQKYQQKLALLKAANLSTQELETWYKNQRDAIEAEEKAEQDAEAAEDKAAQDKARADKHTADIALFQQIANDESLTFDQRRAKALDHKNKLLADQTLTDAQRLEIEKSYSNTVIQLDKATGEARMQAAQAVSNVLGQAANLVGKQTAVGKAISVAQATIDTYASATAAYKSMVKIPFVGPVLAPVAAGLAVASGLANVKKILSVQVPGGGGVAMPSVPSAPSFPSVTAQAPMQAAAQVSTTRLDANTINAVGNATAGRSYVLESDVQDASERNRRLNRAARLG